MSDITLLCILQQRSPSDVYTFSVQVNRDMIIKELKEVIKKKNEPDFDHFPAEDIHLEMVKIKNNRHDVMEFFQEILMGEKLLATQCIKNYWATAPPEGIIHVLVQPPDQVIFIPATGAPEVMILPRNKFEVTIGCESTEPYVFVISSFFCNCCKYLIRSLVQQSLLSKRHTILFGLPGYELTMYIDEIGLLKHLPKNPLASCLYYGGKTGDVEPGIRGHAVLTDYYKKLTIDDFRFVLSEARKIKPRNLSQIWS